MKNIQIVTGCLIACLLNLPIPAIADTEELYSPIAEHHLLSELTDSPATASYSLLESLVERGSPLAPRAGYATYYAKRFEGRRTTSGHIYHPDKMTAAHYTLPFGTVVRVVNPDTKQEVHVVINDRCAPQSFQLIDLSRAAAKKIGLWGKGKIKVMIIPLMEGELEDDSEEPA